MKAVTLGRRFLTWLLWSSFVFASQPILYWKNNALMRLEASGALYRIGSDGTAQAIDQLRLENLKSVVPWEGTWYATRFQRTRQDKGPDKRVLEFLQSADGKAWEVWASLSLQDGQGQPSYFLPLGGDKVLMVASSSWLSDGKASGRFALGRRQPSGGLPRLVLERVVPTDLPKEVEQQVPEVLGPAFFFPQVLPVPDGWALVHASSGQVWTFWTEGGIFRLCRTAVYPWMLEGFAKRQRFETPILGTCPQVDGTLLVAARSISGVIQTRPTTDQGERRFKLPQGGAVLNRDALLQQMKDRVKAEAPEYERMRLDQWRNNPDLVWFEVDSKEGRARPVHPPGGPSKLPDRPPFRFTLDGKGRVRTSASAETPPPLLVPRTN